MELGIDSQKEHKAIISLIDKHHWEAVVLVGKNFKEVNKNHIICENSAEAAKWLEKENPQNSLILIKGSRSMQMEKALSL